MSVPALKALLGKYGLTPDKQFGQHFLCHPRIIQRIVNAVYGDRILEIGPGPAVLTHFLCKKKESCPDLRIVIIEKDRRLGPLLLKECPLAEMYIQDALDLDWQLYHDFFLVSNLPYHVSVPLILRYIRQACFMRGAVLMMQKEVADKILARPGDKSYGRLAVMVQTYTDVIRVTDVPSSAFWPKPSVVSSVLSFKAKTPWPTMPFSSLERTAESAFFHRRKMLHHNFYPCTHPLWIETGIDPRRRAETLTIQEFTQLTRGYDRYVGIH